MSDKPQPPKRGLEEPEAEYRDDERPLTDAEIDAWLERNHEVLNASIREARAQIARDEYYTWEEVKAKPEAQAKRRIAEKGRAFVVSPRVAFSPEALADVEKIERCMAERDGEARTTGFRKRLDKSMQTLAFMPGIGSRRDYLDEDVRAFPVVP